MRKKTRSIARSVSRRHFLSSLFHNSKPISVENSYFVIFESKISHGVPKFTEKGKRSLKKASKVFTK